MGVEHQILDVISVRLDVNGILVVEMTFVIFQEYQRRIQLDDDVIQILDVGRTGQIRNVFFRIERIMPRQVILDDVVNGLRLDAYFVKQYVAFPHHDNKRIPFHIQSEVVRAVGFSVDFQIMDSEFFADAEKRQLDVGKFHFVSFIDLQAHDGIRGDVHFGEEQLGDGSGVVSLQV